MKMRAGFNFAFECPQPTPMLLALDVQPSTQNGDFPGAAAAVCGPIHPR